MKLSTRTRLTLFFTALFSTLLILCFTILYVRISIGLRKDFRSEMIHDGRFIAELFKEELKLNSLDEFKEEIEEFGIELQVLDQNKKEIVQSEGWGQANVIIDEGLLKDINESAAFREIIINGKHFSLFSRLVHIPSVGQYSLHILRSEDSLRNTTTTILLWIIIVTPVMVLLSAIAGYLFSTKTLETEQRAFDRLKNFTADAAHELRIPLTALRGNLEVALRKDRPTQEYKETIADALEEAENLSQLTQDLLLLAQTDAQQLKLHIQEVNLRTFLEDVFSLAEALPDEKNIQKILMPSPEAVVRFDPDRIKQLLLNLMDNAVKYGIPNGELSLQAEMGSGDLKFIVRDNGIGIPLEEQEKIFGRFFRVDKSRSREQGGSGLGLSIAQWIVKAHKGDITVDSQEGKGSVFTVILPIK